jgi:hypothetical protein
MTEMTETPAQANPTIWDPLVRIFHWALVLSVRSPEPMRLLQLMRCLHLIVCRNFIRSNAFQLSCFNRWAILFYFKCQSRIADIGA